MPSYQFGNSPIGSSLGQTARRAVQNLRLTLDDLNLCMNAMNQQTDQQIVESFGVQPVKDASGNIVTTAEAQAAAFKAEWASDVGALQTIDAQLQQFLAQMS